MTRKEAREAIKEAYGSSEYTDEIIKALEQEPCACGKDINVPATDCISRQEAINSLGECPINWTDSDGEVTAERDWKDTVEMLKSLPSVIPQPKIDVLDKIKVEIKALSPKPTAYDVVDGNPVKDAIWETLIEVDKIIDKYKTESEE